MKKILIIEDNLLNLKLFVDLLEYQKYDVTTATDGLIGYEKIKNYEFDLILLDIQLPVLDGISLIKKLRDEKIKYPEIIIVSAFATENEKKIVEALGIKEFITKPIDMNNFIAKVKEALG